MFYYNYNKQKTMMAIDWLQWSGYLIGDGVNSLPDLECPETYRLEILDGNKIFKWRAILYDYRGRKVITMLWSPKSQLMQYNLITFQVSNLWFYETENIQSVIDLAASCFNYQFATFSRIDICVDFELGRKQKKIIRGLYNHTIVCGGKREGSIWWSVDNGEDFPHDFNFGSFKSSIRWKLYNKSKELKVGTDCEEKPYIINRWLENGMDKTIIWRLEVSINDFNKFYIKNQPYNVTTTITTKESMVIYNSRTLVLDDINNLMMMEIYSDLYYKRFQLLEKKHSRRENDTRVYLFELEHHKIITPVKQKEGNHVDNSVMSNLIRVIESDGAKRNIKMLQSSCDALFWFVKYNSLDNLFTKYKNMAVENWIEEKLSLAGDGIVRLINQ